MAIEVVSTETQNNVTAPKSATVATKPEPVAEKPETSEPLAASDTANTEDTSANEDAETDSQDTDENEQTDKPKRKSGRQREKDKLARLESEVSFLREQAMKQAPAQEKPETKAAINSEAEPNEDNFDSHKEYLKAVARWEIKSEMKAEKEKEQKAKHKADFETDAQKLNEEIKEFSKKHEDFDDLMEDVADINSPFTLQQCIRKAKNRPELMYALASDREEFARICKLDALDIAVEIGKIQERLSKSSDEKPETPETKTTKAPKPISPVGSSATGGGKKTIFTAQSQAEYEAIRVEQRKNRSSWG